ncbi:MAG: chaperone modulator CbpM [bacterium]
MNKSDYNIRIQKISSLDNCSDNIYKFTSLSNICTAFCLSRNTVYFFIDEGLIAISKENNCLFMDSSSINKLKTISHLKNDLDINNEGISVILSMREKVINYQDKLKIIADSLKKSSDVEEILNNLKNCGFFDF